MTRRFAIVGKTYYRNDRSSPHAIARHEESFCAMVPHPLLESIRLNPEENGPREALASWYEQRGDLRGRYIRYQLERHELEGVIKESPVEQSDRAEQAYLRKYELETLERDLFEEYGAEWLSEMGIPLGDSRKESVKITWERGLISTLWVNWDRVGDIDPGLLQQHFVDTVGVSTGSRTNSTTVEQVISWLEAVAPIGFALSFPKLSEEELVALFSSPMMKAVHTLHLDGVKVGDSCLNSLLESECLAQLRTLRISSSTCGPLSLATIANSARFQHLRTLSLRWAEFQNAEVEVLANSTTLRQLTTLDLTYSAVPARGAAALFRSPVLDGVKCLDLSGSKVDADVVDALVHSRYLTKLQSLDMSSSGLSDDLLKRFLHTTNLPSLKELFLAGMRYNVANAELLADSPLVSALHGLDLSFCGMSEAQAEVLFRSPAVRNLHWLQLRYNSLSADAVQRIATSPFLKNLRKLDLSTNRLDDCKRGPELGPIVAIEALSRLPHLRELDLSWGSGDPSEYTYEEKTGSVSAEAMLAGVRAGYLTSVYEINLLGCELGDDWVSFLDDCPQPYAWRVLRYISNLSERGALALCNARVFPHLKKVDIDNESDSPDVLARLAKRFGRG